MGGWVEEGLERGGPKRRGRFGFDLDSDARDGHGARCVVEGDIGRGQGRGKTAEAQMEEYSQMTIAPT